MEIKFIGQGFNIEADTSVAKSLMEALSNKNYNSFQCIVAFASRKGITGLTEHIINAKSHIQNFRVIVGIDEKGTSKEALEALLEWEVECFVFSVRQKIIVHPKIYLFEGDQLNMAIIGSNNLTGTGLVNNIESSVQIKYTNDESNLIDQIKEYFNPILNTSGESNVLYPLNQELIDDLVRRGKVPTQSQQRGSRTNRQNTNSNNDDTFGSIQVQSNPTGFNPAPPLQDESEEDSNDGNTEINYDELDIIEEVNTDSISVEPEQAHQTEPLNMWIETGAMTGGSRNILDLSKKGKLDGILKFGSVSFFGVNPENYEAEIDLTFEFMGKNYPGNTILYTQDNSNWRMQFKGRTEDGNRLTTAVRENGDFMRKILVFTRLNSSNYSITFHNMDRKAYYQGISVDRAKGGNGNGREYGVF